ncbi:BPSL0067 family protein [Roseateles agri]|nr:BPSL0067 family protein [Paucibacter sp. R3-3]
MAHVATDYLTNPKAPLGDWVCTRSSGIAPFTDVPPAEKQHGPNFCGQCVSYVTTVCTTLPVATSAWKKGVQVRGATGILPGTAIATFNANGHYSGHAAVYESQTAIGINVVDQWVTPPATAIHKRLLRFGAHGNSNNGDNFFVVD